MRGYDYLKQAEDYLQQGNLTQAAKHFWSATFYLNEWPPNLHRKAKDVVHLLLSEGPIGKTLSRMSDTERRDLEVRIAEIIQLAAYLRADAPDDASKFSAEKHSR